jgi:hypothetical protein
VQSSQRKVTKLVMVCVFSVSVCYAMVSFMMYDLFSTWTSLELFHALDMGEHKLHSSKCHIIQY